MRHLQMMATMSVLAHLTISGGICFGGMLPAPTGSFEVGTAYLSFVDSSRFELFTNDASDRREITCRLWHPALPNDTTRPAFYIPEAGRMVEQFKLPRQVATVSTHSYLEAPVDMSAAPFPVLLFSHGWGEYAEHNTCLCEELASHGYLVISITHHYEAKFWRCPGGAVGTIAAAGAPLEARLAEQRNPDALKLFRLLPSRQTAGEQLELMRQSTRLLPLFLRESPRIWAADMQSVLDQLPLRNETDLLLKQSLDLERIGAFGMSMGGIATSLISAQDDRIKAAANLDGGLYGDVLDLSIPVPFMFLSSERYRDYGDLFLSYLETTGYAAFISGSDHLNFSDLGLLDPSASMLGSIAGERMIMIVRACLVSFFSLHLKNSSSVSPDQLSESFHDLICERKE